MASATVRECRLALDVSQSAFAASLGVPVETYRPWDAGRRLPPDAILLKAQVLAAHVEATRLLPLDVLAPMVGVHVRTLRAAARDGRLPVTYDTKTTFRQLRGRATLADATEFRQTRFRQHAAPTDRPTLPTWAAIPADYDRRLRAIRTHLRLSQRALAHRIGAAGKAVVYQWESRKRIPSPILWSRVLMLVRRRPSVTQAMSRRASTLLPAASEPLSRPTRRNP